MSDTLLIQITALVCFSIFIAALSIVARKRSKKTGLYGCLILVLAALFTISIIPPDPPAQPVLAEMPVQSDQIIFNAWYANYTKQIDALDMIWLKYHRLIKLVRDDDIAIINASIRMDALYEESLAAHQKIEKIANIPHLSAINHAQVENIIEKTRAFSADHHAIIEKSKFILDSQNSRNKKREELVHDLQQIIIMDTLPQLNIIPHIAQIRENIASVKPPEI